MKPSPGDSASRLLAPREHAGGARAPQFPGRVSGADTSRPLNGRAILREDDWHRVGDKLSLSPRELQLVQHIFEGKKLTAIAQDMNLSLGTVKTYCQRAYQKLQVSNQRELIFAVLCAHLTT